jgi:hypothetical protein
VVADGTTSAWRARQGPIRIGAVVALALAIAFVVWLLVRGNDNSSPKPAASPAPPTTTVAPAKPVRTFGPVAATVAKLRVIARVRPVYWVGPKHGVTYELTRTSNGRTFIRYLPRGVRVGSRRNNVLFVGTYAVPDAYKALRKAAKASGDVTFKAPRGGLAIYSRAGATNVYVAYPGSNYQIEVYDPNPTRARQLVKSGAIRPID